MSQIPKEIVDDHKRGVENLRFYGLAVCELDRDELLAFANCCAQSLRHEREQHSNYRRTFTALNAPPPTATVLEDTKEVRAYVEEMIHTTLEQVMSERV